MPSKQKQAFAQTNQTQVEHKMLKQTRPMLIIEIENQSSKQRIAFLED